MDDPPVLIAGAGPTGLAAALLLATRGIRSRIVDPAPEPSRHSKALAVNPRTLELLEPTGVTARMLAEARPIDGVTFHQDWTRPIARVDVADAHPRFRMSVLSQARSEAMLADALAAHGIRPERGVKLDELAQAGGRVQARLAHADGRMEDAEAAILFAADGAHSTARHALGLAFDGSAFPEPWPLYDIRLDTALDLARAHLSYSDEGLVFMLALEPGIWRVLGNVREPLRHLPPGASAGEILWQSDFHISHRVAGAAAVGNVCLGGDAAHIHSPVGARGMNLGIEDAYVFAACATDALAGRPGRLADYGRLRHAVHKDVVRRIALMTRVARGRPAPFRFLRRFALPALAAVPPATRMMRATVTGLDHPVQVA